MDIVDKNMPFTILAFVFVLLFAGFSVADHSGNGGDFGTFNTYTYVTGENGLTIFDDYFVPGLEQVNEYGAYDGVVRIDGNHLFHGKGDVFSIVDISDREQPQELAFMRLTDPALGMAEISDIFVEGSYIYLAVRNRGLVVIDANSREHPHEIAVVRILDAAVLEPARYFGTVYVGDDSKENDNFVGMKLVDVRNPEQPMVRGIYRDAPVKEIVYYGHQAYIITEGHGGNNAVRVLDISDETNPTVIGEMHLQGANALEAYANSKGRVLYVTCSEGLNLCPLKKEGKIQILV